MVMYKTDRRGGGSKNRSLRQTLVLSFTPSELQLMKVSSVHPLHLFTTFKFQVLRSNDVAMRTSRLLAQVSNKFTGIGVKLIIFY